MTDHVTVVLWKWRSTGNWKKYHAGHVNAVVTMVDANLDVPCDFVLITDDGLGVDPGVRIVPLKRVAAALPGFNAPQRNAYRRIGLFADDMKSILGKRLMQLDLDAVITGNITHLADRPEPFVIWKSPSRGPLGYALNPSYLLLTAGAMCHVYDGYCENPDEVAQAARAAGFTATDQSVISHLAGKDAATVDEKDGIISFRDHMKAGELPLPSDARIVSFMDRFDPADPDLQDRCPWIKDHYPFRAERIAA